MLDAHESPHEFRDAPQMPAGLTYLFEELYTAHYSKERKPAATTAGWPSPWAGRWTPSAQREAKSSS